MRRELVIHSPGAVAEPRTLAAPCTVGGSQADGIPVPGLPPRALTLEPCSAGVVVEAAAAGVHVGGHSVPPGTRRLLRAGERVELSGAALELRPTPEVEGGATRVAAAALLRDAAGGASPVIGPHLVVLTGAAAGTRLPLKSDQTIGRGRAAGLRLDDPQASRVHARIRLKSGGAEVVDLGSKNGVRVNGVRVERRPCALRPGDALQIGETVLALETAAPGEFEPARAPPASGPPPAARGGRRGRRRHLAAAALLALSAAALALAGS